jgi:hypothetical protein
MRDSFTYLLYENEHQKYRSQYLRYVGRKKSFQYYSCLLTNTVYQQFFASDQQTAHFTKLYVNKNPIIFTALINSVK